MLRLSPRKVPRLRWRLDGGLDAQHGSYWWNFAVYAGLTIHHVEPNANEA